jgi:FkbM family methyltransferase
MKPESIMRLSRLTRPVMRYRTPVIHRVLKWLLNILCPPAKKDNAVHLVASFDGGLINVDTSSSIEYHLLFRGCHEPEIVNLIKQVVRPGNFCLDIGANIGAHTLLMARMAGSTGHVIALEPHPGICHRLRQNICLNRLTNIEVVNAALADRDGTIDLYGFAADAFEQGISSLRPDHEAKTKIEVRAIRGATLVREQRIEACDFIKIDVEGAESLVLRELSDLISAHRPIILFEYRKQHWEKFASDVSPILSRLRAERYDLYYIRRNVTRPLGSNQPPDSCELFCLPCALNTVADGN